MARIIAIPFAEDFSDLEGNAGAPTLSGSPLPSISSDESKFYDGSLYLSGSGTSVVYPAIEGLNFGKAGDWTIDFWFKPLALAGASTLISFSVSGISNHGLMILTNDNKLAVNNGLQAAGNGGTLTVNNWQHGRISRKDTVLKAWIDGSLAFTNTINQDYGDLNATIKIGTRNVSPAPLINAFFQDLVVYIGEALWDESFTPPESIMIPQVLGETEADAIQILEGAGFTVGTVSGLSTAANLGLVIAQSAPDETNKITLTIGGGQGAMLPDVTGMTITAAKLAVEAAGFDVISKGFATGRSVAYVLGQIPTAGLANVSNPVVINYTIENEVSVEISSWSELDAIRLALDGDYIQTRWLLKTDEDYTGIGDNWLPIGNDLNKFTGTYQGASRGIEGIKFEGEISNANGNGLFGAIRDASISNLYLEDFSFINTSSNDYGGVNMGALVGDVWGDSFITNCHVNNFHMESHNVVGGLLASINDNSNVLRCSATNGYIKIRRIWGGAAGHICHIVGGAVRESFAENIDIDLVARSSISGFTNRLYGNCVIENCFSRNVTGFGDIYERGGFLLDTYAPGGEVINCYAVNSQLSRVGFCPDTWITTTGCYYDAELSGNSDINAGTIPKTTAAMMQQSTFENWDFDDIWQIDDGNDYPRLQWASPPPPAQVEVPNIVGETQVVAESAITGAGLTIGSITSQHSATVAVGLVISQQPAAGGMVDIGSAVGFVVSLGENPTPPVPPKPQPTGKFSGETVILFDSILEQPGVTITASSTAAGTFLENLKNDTTFEYWASGTIGEA